MQLESQVTALQEDLSSFGKGKRVDKSEALPREPAKHTLSGHRMPITVVKFHPIYSVCISAGEDSVVKVWDYESGSYERTFKGHTDAVQDVAFNQDGSVLASCSADLSIKLWDFEHGKCVKTLNGHDHNVSSIVFLPSGNQILSASRDKTIKMWDVSSGYCTRTYSDHDQWVRVVRVNSDGTIMASGSMDQTVKLWNVKTGECTRTLRDHDHVIETIEFTDSVAAEDNIRAMLSDQDGSKANGVEKKEDGEKATGAFLVSGSRDKTIRIWEVATGRCVKVLVCFSCSCSCSFLLCSFVIFYISPPAPIFNIYIYI